MLCAVGSGWQRGSIAWHELRHRCSACSAKLDVPGSAPGPGPSPPQDPQRRNQHPNRRSPRGGGGPASGLPVTAPRPSPGPVLYALAASRPARHASTDLHTSSYLALLIYAASSHTSAICFSISCNSVRSMFVCYVWRLLASIVGSFGSINAQRQISAVVLFCLSPLRVSEKIRPTSDWVFTLNSVREPSCFLEFTAPHKRANHRARHLHSSRQELKTKTGCAKFNTIYMGRKRNLQRKNNRD